MQRLTAKVALVTGGATGLGKAIAGRLASEGANVVITDRNRAIGEATATELGLVFLEQDVANETRWSEIVAEVEKRFGRLDILVNNAGVTGPTDHGNPENTQLADWAFVQRVNVEGVFLGCRAVIPLMRRLGGGSIINISSNASECPGPDAMAYATSKAAVRHLTTSVAFYCAQSGSKIRCNSVHPGTCLTDMVRQGAAGFARSRGTQVQVILEEMRSRIPLGEFIEPEDIANAVLFLASDEAKKITGVKLIVDGGQTCR
jgi:3(or 17)beta-hydroxysteroid dehydrogenase